MRRAAVPVNRCSQQSENDMQDQLDVVVIGNVGIDTNVYLPGADIDFTVEANFTDNRDYVGQAGGFTARGFAQLGKRTAFVGYVGDDWAGRFVRAEFARDGIDTTALFIDPAGTSRSVNFMYRDGRRKNFYDGKRHMQLQPDLDRCAAVLRRARLALFHLPNWARHLLPLARPAGLTVACDLQDIVTLDDPYRQDFLAHADILFCSGVNFPSPEALIAPLLEARPQQSIVVGLGAQGCAVGTRAGVQCFPPPALDLSVVDTNGAGDGLAVGFLSSYVLNGASLAEAVLRGQIAARHTCALKASSYPLITQAQLDERYWAVEQLASSRRAEPA